LAYQVPSL
jgi:integrase/recombinase XerD